MATRAQLVTAGGQARAAGNRVAAERFANMIREGRFDPDPEDVPVIETPQEEPQDARLPGENRRQRRGTVAVDDTAPVGPEESLKDFGEDALNVIAELAASANRSVTEFIDFVGPDTLNAMLRLAGSDSQVPTLTGALESTGIQGGFMEPGTGRDIVQALGQTVTAGGGLVGVGARNLTKFPGMAAEFIGVGTQSPVRGAAHTATNLIPGVNTVPPSQTTTPRDVSIPSNQQLLPSEQVQNIQQDIAHARGDVSTASTKTTPAGEVVMDKKAREVIKGGMSEGAVAMIKAAPPAAKSKMLKMVDRLDAGLSNQRIRLTERPGDVVGNSLSQRIRIVSKANKRAGKQLDSVAKGLKGQTVDVSFVVDKFLSQLEGKGITVKNGIPNFEGSDIEGVDEAQRIVKNLLKRMSKTKAPDAYDVHRMKKFIDEQVDYGKGKGGLSGTMENMAKGLRRDLDELLDINFPDYDAVNQSYAETVSVLNGIQDIAGKKIDLLGPNADSAIGTLSRRLLSNAQSRVPLQNNLDELDKVAQKYNTDKIDLDDDIIVQVGFVDELEKLMGPSAPTSLFGEVAKAGMGGAQEKLGVAERGVKAVFGKDEKRKLKDIRDLLSE